jgi:hypothetical protein
MPTIDAYGLLGEPLEGIVSPRIAAGIYIQNNRFGDHSAEEFDGTRSGEDGKTWKETPFRDWYQAGNDATPDDFSHPFSSQYAQEAAGAAGSSCVRMATNDATATIHVQNHDVYAATLHSGMIEFGRFFTGHEAKPLTIAFTMRASSNTTKGEIKVALGCYNESYAYLGEELFDSADLPEDPEDLETWQRQFMHTFSAIPTGTHYIVVHIGLKAATGGIYNYLDVGSVSLMTNPFNPDRYDTSTPEHFVDFDPVRMAANPGFGMMAPGTRDQRMMTGRLHRQNVAPEGPKWKVDTSWYREDAATTRALLAAWEASTHGLGVPVPHPVPLCIDFGMGGPLPFFGYYHVVGDLSSSFSRHWTVGSSGGYDMGLSFEEI